MVVETGPFVSSHHRPWISTMTVGVRGTLTKFKRRRGVAKSVNVSRFPHPHAKFHHRGVLGLAEAQEQRGRARVMFRDGIQILVERRF
jgi:hypothetical protein